MKKTYKIIFIMLIVLFIMLLTNIVKAADKIDYKKLKEYMKAINYDNQHLWDKSIDYVKEARDYIYNIASNYSEYSNDEKLKYSYEQLIDEYELYVDLVSYHQLKKDCTQYVVYPNTVVDFYNDLDADGLVRIFQGIMDVTAENGFSGNAYKYHKDVTYDKAVDAYNEIKKDVDGWYDRFADNLNLDYKNHLIDREKYWEYHAKAEFFKTFYSNVPFMDYSKRIQKIDETFSTLKEMVEAKEHLDEIEEKLGDPRLTDEEIQELLQQKHEWEEIYSKFDPTYESPPDSKYFSYKSYSPSIMHFNNEGVNTSVAKIGGGILSVIRNVGVVVAVVSLIIIGIKYMIGSAEEKADYKKTLIPYTIGLVIFVAITVLLTLLIKVCEIFYN